MFPSSEARNKEFLIYSEIKYKDRGLRGYYHAVLDDLGPAGDGLAGVVDDGVGIVLDGAGEVVLAADLDGFVDGRSQPRH